MLREGSALFPNIPPRLQLYSHEHDDDFAVTGDPFVSDRFDCGNYGTLHSRSSIEDEDTATKKSSCCLSGT